MSLEVSFKNKTDHDYGCTDRFAAVQKLSPNLATAIDYVLNTDFSQLGPGRYEVAGESVFAIVNEYSTKPPAECEPESHRQYIDIQVMLEGD